MRRGGQGSGTVTRRRHLGWRDGAVALAVALQRQVIEHFFRAWWRDGAVALAVALGACGARPARPATPVVPSCSADRMVVLASQADVARHARCATFDGVTIRSGGALDVSVLHALTTITGDLVVGPTVGVQEITLGELRGVGGAIHVVSNGLLQGLYFPRLERAGRIEIDGNPVVTTISLPRLQAIHGALRITDNASLELVDIPALVAIDQELTLSGDPRLTLVEAAQLRHAAAVQIDAPRLAADVAGQLRAAAPAP